MNRRQFLWTAGTATAGLTAVAPAAADSHGAHFSNGGQQLWLEAAEESVLEGQTQFADGVPLRVRLRSDGDSPFIKSTETTVREEGQFRVSFDLTDISVGTSVTATANWYDITIAQTTGRVVAADPSIDLTYEGDELTLAPETDQTVTGTTSLPAGEPLVVRAKSDGQNPFIKSDDPTVDSDGSFTATLDLSGIDPETDFSVVVLYAGTQRASADGVVSD